MAKKTIYEEELQDKSFEDIAKEEEKVEEPEEKIEKVEKEEPKVDVEDIAKKTASEVANEFEAKLKKIDDDKRLSDETRQKKKEELTAKWSGKAEDGSAVPKDYEEIVAETKRITREEILAEIDERDKEKERKATEDRETQETQKKQAEEQNTKWVEDQQKQINEEFDELYSDGLLARPKSQDPEDPQNKERQDLLNLGIKINTERIAKGLPPISSITRIYHNFYKKSKGIGANAPIGGNRPASSSNVEDGFVYARDHNKSWDQLRREPSDE